MPVHSFNQSIDRLANQLLPSTNYFLWQKNYRNSTFLTSNSFRVPAENLHWHLGKQAGRLVLPILDVLGIARRLRHPQRRADVRFDGHPIGLGRAVHREVNNVGITQAHVKVMDVERRLGHGRPRGEPAHHVLLRTATFRQLHHALSEFRVQSKWSLKRK